MFICSWFNSMIHYACECIVSGICMIIDTKGKIEMWTKVLETLEFNLKPRLGFFWGLSGIINLKGSNCIQLPQKRSFSKLDILLYFGKKISEYTRMFHLKSNWT